MDRRWIYIIIIFIIGFAALFYIAESSTTVGSAVIGINTFTTSIPDDYNIENSQNDYATLIKRQTHEKIYIKDEGKGNLTEKVFNEKMSSMENNPNITRISQSKEVYNNVTFNVIEYERIFNNNTNKAFVFMEYKHTFLIESTNFKNPNTLTEKTRILLDTLQPDYKKTQD